MQYLLTQEEMDEFKSRPDKKQQNETKAQLAYLQQLVIKHFNITCKGYCGDCPLSGLGKDVPRDICPNPEKRHFAK